jgi:hypothetical protein
MGDPPLAAAWRMGRLREAAACRVSADHCDRCLAANLRNIDDIL